MAKFRSKMGVVAIVSVVALSVVLYLVVVLPWAKEVAKAAEADAASGGEVVPKLVTLGGHHLVSHAKRAASQKQFIDAIQKEETPEKRKAVYDAITKYDAWLSKVEGKATDFIAVLDEHGKVIARDRSIQDMHGESLGYVSVKHALKGRATSDVWLSKNHMMRAGTAPIYIDGQVKGVVVIGYSFTDKDASVERRQLGAHVLYFVDGAVRASSFPKKGAVVKDVDSRLLKSKNIVKAVEDGKVSTVFKAKLGGADYVGVAGPLPAPATLYAGISNNGEGAKATSAAAKKAGFIVLVNVTNRNARVRSTRWILLGFTVVLMLFAMGLMFFVAKHFVDAQDKLELGVSEVISGNMDYTFDVQEEFEGLANAMNVMLARLLGRPEPGEDDDGSDASWRPDVITIETAFGDDGKASELAGIDRDSYLASLYQEYVAARSAAGLSIEGIDEAGFNQKVIANEAMLKAKHKCEEIRFTVLSQSGRVSLKPFKIS
jgi:hypothetical protein